MSFSWCEPKQSSCDVSTNHGQTSNKISVPEIHVHTITEEGPETSSEMERESGETLEVIYEEEEGQESDYKNSYEFSEEYEYEAGVMPANNDEASSKPSFTSSGTHSVMNTDETLGRVVGPI